MKVLMLGCGRSKARNIIVNDKEDFDGDDLTTIDMDPNSNPTIRMDLSKVACGERFDFDDGTFDEIHAYDILEHIGVQGDWRGYFTEFGEYHRILKKEGQFFITVPIGADAIADPGHSRFFSRNHFFFLSQKFYERERKTKTMATDYRWFWNKDFEVIFMEQQENHHLAVILKCL